jgi:alkanesulfonate monooxygenase SsuD/methylene tetrahydromethanopterin reductase-like flavin-dependent oxidoreductase (luciferase family)
VFGGGLAYGPAILAEYRKTFVRGQLATAPLAAIAVTVVCETSETRARATDAALAAQGCYPSNIVGTPPQCVAAMRSFAYLFDVNEIIVATFVTGRRARRDLYQSLAEEARLMKPSV